MWRARSCCSGSAPRFFDDELHGDAVLRSAVSQLYSNDAIAAVVPAGALAWTLASLPLGIAMYATTFVAQYEGAGVKHRIGPIVWQALWIALICVPIYILMGYWGEHLFRWSGHAPPMVANESSYFFALCFGSGAVVANGAIVLTTTAGGRFKRS